MSAADVPAKITCVKCRREIADGQRVEHRGELYCASCVGEALNHEVAEAAPGHNVTLAVMLSFLPGLGQMYNRQVTKGFLIMAAFFFSFALHEETGSAQVLVAALAPALYFWNLFDAYWTAKRIRSAGQPEQEAMPAVEDWSFSSEKRLESSTTPTFGVLLIVLGILFLLNNYGVTWLTVGRLWPTTILALGLWLLASFVLSRRAPAASEPLPEETHHGENS